MQFVMLKITFIEFAILMITIIQFAILQITNACCFTHDNHLSNQSVCYTQDNRYAICYTHDKHYAVCYYQDSIMLFAILRITINNLYSSLYIG